MATVARKHFLFTGRNLGADLDSEVGDYLMAPVGSRERKRVRKRERDRARQRGRAR